MVRGVALQLLFEIRIKEYYPKIVEYPQSEHLQKLKELFPNHPWSLDGYCACIRHNFIRKQVKNKDYFAVQTSPLLNIEHNALIEQQCLLRLPKNDSICQEKLIVQMTANQDLLFKFSAHICSPTPPILEMSHPVIEKYGLEDEFNVYLTKSLRTKNFANGEGFLNADKIKKEFNNFSTVVFDEMIEFMRDKNICVLKDKELEQYRIQFNQAFSKEKIANGINEIDKIGQTLSGFNGLDALFLFHQVLTSSPYGLNPILLQQVKELVLGCLELAFQAQKANKLSQQYKHQGWFDISGQVVASLVKKPRSLLFQIGTPVYEAQKYSTHAFYVAVNFSQQTKQFQIIITNGGSNVERFHVMSPKQHPNDRHEYCYSAFEPFDLKEYYEELQNYIYLLISLEYRTSINENAENKNNPNGYINLLRNVYLRDNNKKAEECFYGYQNKKFTKFKRRDLDDCFLSQFTGKVRFRQACVTIPYKV